MPEHWLDWVKLATGAVGVLGGLWALIKGVDEYARKNRLERYQQFMDQHKAFVDDDVLTGVWVALLDTGRMASGPILPGGTVGNGSPSRPSWRTSP